MCVGGCRQIWGVITSSICLWLLIYVTLISTVSGLYELKFNVVRFAPRKSVEKSQKVSILDGLVRMLVYTVGCRPVH